MKRLLVYLSALLFFVTMVSPILAVDNTVTTMPDNQPFVSPSPSPTPVEYQLPYPGLLPDNPLYKLKTFRDKIIEFLISDPLKKAEFDILQGDKRYNAGLYLFRASPQKQDIIVSTLSKADNYMEEAIGQLSLAKKQGQEIQDLTSKLLLSNKKHLEVMKEIEQTAPDALKKSLAQEEKRIAHITSEATTQLQHK